jgi:hypothetical protein
MDDLILKIVCILCVGLLAIFIVVPLAAESEETSETVVISEIGYKDSENFYINTLSADGGISYMTVAIENTTIYREDPANLKENYAIIKSGGFSSDEVNIYITNDTELKYIENRTVPPFEQNEEELDSLVFSLIIAIIISTFFGVIIVKINS